MVSIILTILMFCIVVLIHEGGHFFLARKNGIFVEEFAIGMGPILYEKQGKETLYTVRALPIGGFCRMLGEDDKSNDPRSFSSKSVRARMEVVVAGVIMNFILGFFIFFMLLSYNGYTTTTVGMVREGFPAYNAGLQPGDELKEINGDHINSYNEFSFKLQTADPEDVTIVVERDNEDITLEMAMQYDEESGRYLMGFSPLYKVGYLRSDETLESLQTQFDPATQIVPTKAGFFETIAQTFLFIEFYFYATVASLVGLFTGAVGLSVMSGPIGIVSVVGSEYTAAAAMGFGVLLQTMLQLLGTLSLALAVFNILPIPALDGGRLVFLIIEAVRGKPIDPEKEGTVHFIGFVVLMLFALVVTFSDIIKLF